jgi:hypothetical protein
MLIHITYDIRHLIKLSFNTSKSTSDLDALLLGGGGLMRNGDGGGGGQKWNVIERGNGKGNEGKEKKSDGL